MISADIIRLARARPAPKMVTLPSHFRPVPSSAPSFQEHADASIEAFAMEWRARALRGDKQASYGIVHALEAERRRRRASQREALPPCIPDAPRRAWRQLWRRSATEGRGTVADGCVNPATRTLLAIVRSAER